MDYILQDRFSMKLALKKDAIKLGFVTGLSNRSFAVTNFRDLRAVPGLIVSPEGDVRPWEAEGVTEIEGQVVVFGPWEPGHSLAEIDPKDFTADHLKKIRELSARFVEQGIPVKRYSPAAFYICESGNWIVFPPLLVNFILEQLPEEQTLSLFEYYNHPDLHQERAWVFTLSALSYEIITKEKPFVGKKRNEIHDRIRERRIVPPERLAAGCRKSISAFISRVLCQDPELKGPVFKDWDIFYEDWQKEGAFKEISEEAKQKIHLRKEKEKKKRDRQYKWNLFLNVHKKSLIVGSILTLLGIIMISSILTAVFRPPLTKGMGPEDVVKAYYNAINTLDYPLIRDCIGKDVTQEDLGAVKMEYLHSETETLRRFGNPSRGKMAD